MTETMSADIVLREERTPRRGKQGVECPQELKDTAFSLYAIVCNHDAAAVERLLLERLPDEPIPTARTIRRWAKAEGWAGQSDAIWRSNGKRTIYELRRAMVGNAILGQQIHRDVMTGAYDAKDPWVVAARLKAAEQSNRLLERGVIALAAFDPPSDDQDTRELPIQEREALAAARLVEDRKRAIGRGE